MKPWTPALDAQLTGLYQTMSASQIATLMGRTKASIKNRVNVIGLSKPKSSYNAGCFKPGMVPWNKGKPFDSGGRSHDTRFKKGNKPHTWNPLGHERVCKDGYLQRKMTDTGITRRDYVFVHHLVWVEAYGEIPRGHAVVFRDGNKQNIVIENLECITRQELMRRNSYHTNYPKPLRKLIQLRGAVTRQINRRKESSK